MYAFIHIPKTAGSTLRSQFRRAFKAQHCDIKVPSKLRATQPWITAADLKRIQGLYPNLAGICGHRVVSFNGLKNDYPNIRYFTFLRDPRKRFISHFNHFHRGQTEKCTAEDLAAYASQTENQNIQTYYLCGEHDAQKAIDNMEAQVGMVGLTEHYDESLLMLNRWLDRPEFSLSYETRNRAPSTASLPYLDDPGLRKIIEDANAEDIALYNYVLEKRFPRQLEAYGDSLQADLTRHLEANKSFKEPAEALWSKCKRTLLYKPMLHLAR